MPRDHGLEPPYEEVTGKDVLVVDFSWRTREQNDKMASLAKSFLILDHHKTAEATLAGAPYAIFDMKRSGAGLAWDYLFGANAKVEDVPLGSEQDRPWYVNYVEDRDLWNWKLTHSKEICAYLGTLEFTKQAWETLDQPSFDAARALQLGVGALAHIDHYIREAVKQAQTGIFQGYKTAVLNVPYLNCSEVGNELAKTYQVSLTWFERGDGFIQFSLRSIGDIDVSAIAKIFNGGGHKNAAGFQVGLVKGREIVDQILGR
jgi:oligoribonuclease NrnB/cAMP/cGMP phosphodiesterase (DHH superfamily)